MIKRWYSKMLLVLLATVSLQHPIGSNANPALDSAKRIHELGTPLRVALPRIGQRFDEEWNCDRALGEQRVTLIGPVHNSNFWRKNIAILLSPQENAGVYWNQSENKSSHTIRVSKNRRDLAVRLSNSDQQLFTSFIDGELQWAKDLGWAMLQAEQDPLKRRVLLSRLGKVLFLETMGNQGRELIVSGDPIVIPFSRIIGGRQEQVLREWLQTAHPLLANLESAELGRHAFVFLRERSPSDPLEGGITRSLVLPKGFVSNHGTFLRMPHRPQSQRYKSGFTIPASNDKDVSDRTTFILTPDATKKSGELVDRTFDELLEVASSATGATIISDGYLRPKVQVPANLRLEDCSLEAIARSLAGAWDCDWALGADRHSLIFRAKYWWLEDEANVSPELVDDLRRRFDGNHATTLEDLARLAELDEPQIRKLIDLGICRSVSGILAHGIHDGVGVRPILQVYNRLAPALQDRMRSTEGLPLSQLRPDLLKMLEQVLVGGVGALSDERRSDLVIYIRALKPAPQGMQNPGWEFLIRGADRAGCYFFRSIRPAAN